ncbi:MAG: ATP-dependent DNA helicase RecQ, partial [Alistipes sp.]|nr:ATP-dependent DNA helicase RecQ [Alistipes sp.]
MTKPTIHQILERYWGYKRFRPQQEDIIQSILTGRDTLALMPTGGGKSLTYQVPTMAMEGICVVVTPLIALMKDQVDGLRRVGIKAVALHSGLSQQEIDRQMDNCVFGDVKFLYIAPERINSDVFRLRLEKMKLCLLAVDEAHCISQWGYDFRPAYLTISSIRKVHPKVPVLALTASATKMVTEDIMQQLEFSSPHIIRSEFLRPNLSYSVRHVEDKYGQLLRICGGVPGCGIVYVRTRALAEELAKQLTEDGISAAAYHGGMAHSERNLRQEEWLKNKTRIMVATNAFGMGIDKRDVRFVVHYSLCDSLEYYYQEAGRAGRDGAKAYAVLLMGEEDERHITQTLEREFPPLEEIKTIYEELYTFLQIPIGGGKGQSRIFNIYDFCHRFHRYEGNVVCAIKLLELNGYMTLTDDHDNPARLMFMVERDELYRVRFK